LDIFEDFIDGPTRLANKQVYRYQASGD
jgi:hypothetical protein